MSGLHGIRGVLEASGGTHSIEEASLEEDVCTHMILAGSHSALATL